MKNKYFACLIIFFVTILSVNAQTDTIPLYKQFPDVPPFSIMKVPDSTKFTKADLKKRKPTIIIIFSPDCEHCQHETKELIKNIDLFKNTQIVMCSPLDYKYLLAFYKDFDLEKYPNITVGRDGTYILGTFYNIHNFPSIFVYNKKGQLVEGFDGSVKIEKIAEALQ
jgi:thioredoxin-related protein